MTDTPIDYETAFEEVNTLNYLVGQHADYILPRLDPYKFETVIDTPEVSVVQGLRTELYYATHRTRRTEPNGNYTYRYAPFFRVQPAERTVTDWVRV